jgi:hypothetical protein
MRLFSAALWTNISLALVPSSPSDDAIDNRRGQNRLAIGVRPSPLWKTPY